MNEALALMTPSLDAPYVSLQNSPVYRQFQTMESQILASTGRTVPVKAGAFQSVSLAVLGVMEKAQLDSADQLTAISASRSDQLVTEAALAGGLGLAAVAASVFLLVWFGRKVTRDLGGLNDSVRGMADERLPRVVDRLRRGDDVDVAAESPAPATSTIQEISRIAESFGTVQGAAVSAAVDQARLRKGVNEVFLNISMRNQSLLHRQLGMLDSMERRTSEPGALADLFRLDHLTTRMRRYAEGLIILSGAVPGRGWRDPVPVVDILRAAVAEIEDYVRVDVTSESDDLIAGNAVSDVIHLIAELIENAAAFSPPNTRIEVRAERVGTGLVAEVEDRGLGMSPDELDDINARLASLPEFDLAHSDQLGLFVVSRLAARHAIKVSLRRSVYGGTMAVVLMPFGVVVRQEEASRLAPWAGRPDESGPRSLTGRHRLPPPAVPAGLTGPAEPTGSAGPTGPTGPTGSGPSARNGEAEWPMAPWETMPMPMPMPAEPPGPAPTPALFSPPAPPAPAPLPAPAAPPPGSHLGMPIRVPQANMAPQLRDADPQEPQDPPEDEPWFGARSPEATRSMLTMMQQGWRRGRMDDLDDPEGVPGTGN
jgi:signal transduction histidine kinase